MKKFFVISLIIGTVAVAFTSCRSGKDDPLISFRTRNTRLIGNWKLVDLTKTVIISYGGKDTITSTTTTTYKNGYIFKGTSDSVLYAKNMSIASDGTYTMSERVKNDVSTSGGYWYWLYADEDKIAVRIGSEEYRLDKLSYSDITMVQTKTVKKSTFVNGKEMLNTSTVTNNQEKYSRQ